MNCASRHTFVVDFQQKEAWNVNKAERSTGAIDLQPLVLDLDTKLLALYWSLTWSQVPWINRIIEDGVKLIGLSSFAWGHAVNGTLWQSYACVRVIIWRLLIADESRQRSIYFTFKINHCLKTTLNISSKWTLMCGVLFRDRWCDCRNVLW